MKLWALPVAGVELDAWTVAPLFVLDEHGGLTPRPPGFKVPHGVKLRTSGASGRLVEGTWASVTAPRMARSEGVDLLQGIGGQWAADVSGDLGGGSDGNPGTPYIFTQSIDFANTVDIESMYWAHFTAGQPLGGFMDGFFDGFVIPPESGQWIEIFPSLFTQAGTVTLSYEYAAVPEPGSLAVLGVIGGLMLVRRRR